MGFSACLDKNSCRVGLQGGGGEGPWPWIVYVRGVPADEYVLVVDPAEFPECALASCWLREVTLALSPLSCVDTVLWKFVNCAQRIEICCFRSLFSVERHRIMAWSDCRKALARSAGLVGGAGAAIELWAVAVSCEVGCWRFRSDVYFDGTGAWPLSRSGTQNRKSG